MQFINCTFAGDVAQLFGRQTRKKELYPAWENPAS